MKELLWLNACVRHDSRTEKLTRRFLLSAKADFSIREVRVGELGLLPLDEASLRRRDLDIQAGRLDASAYAPARAFAEADELLISAPYWDASFPAALKIYLENICVNGVTFAYGEGGSLVKKCRADRLTYITTSGGFLPAVPSVKLYLQELCTLFSIGTLDFHAVPGLDVFPDQVDRMLETALSDMLRGEG